MSHAAKPTDEEGDRYIARQHLLPGLQQHHIPNVITNTTAPVESSTALLSSKMQGGSGTLCSHPAPHTAAVRQALHTHRCMDSYTHGSCALMPLGTQSAGHTAEPRHHQCGVGHLLQTSLIQTADMHPRVRQSADPRAGSSALRRPLAATLACPSPCLHVVQPCAGRLRHRMTVAPRTALPALQSASSARRGPLAAALARPAPCLHVVQPRAVCGRLALVIVVHKLAHLAQADGVTWLAACFLQRRVDA